MSERPIGCNCRCHTSPGVKHMIACCDKPPFSEDDRVILIVDRSSSKCGYCHKGADPYEDCHDTVMGYYARDAILPEPCHKEFTHITSFYTDGTGKINNRLMEMRPDLELIPIGDIMNK